MSVQGYAKVGTQNLFLPSAHNGLLNVQGRNYDVLICEDIQFALSVSDFGETICVIFRAETVNVTALRLSATLVFVYQTTRRHRQKTITLTLSIVITSKLTFLSIRRATHFKL